MNKVIRHILPILCGSLLVIGMSCAFIAGKVKRSSMKCERLEVTILDSLINSFVSESDVKKYLDREYGTYVGMPLDSLDLVKMEKIKEEEVVGKGEAICDAKERDSNSGNIAST